MEFWCDWPWFHKWCRGMLWCNCSSGTCIQPAHLCCNPGYLNTTKMSDHATELWHECSEDAVRVKGPECNPVLTGVGILLWMSWMMERHTSACTRLCICISECRPLGSNSSLLLRCFWWWAPRNWEMAGKSSPRRGVKRSNTYKIHWLF